MKSQKYLREVLCTQKESLKDNWTFLLHLFSWMNLKHSPVIVFIFLNFWKGSKEETKIHFTHSLHLVVKSTEEKVNWNKYICNTCCYYVITKCQLVITQQGVMSLLTEFSLMMNVKSFIIVQNQRLLKMIFISCLKSFQNGSVSRIFYVITWKNESTENSLCN